MDDLKPGVYERLVTAGLDDQLRGIEPDVVHRYDLDPAGASEILERTGARGLESSGLGRHGVVADRAARAGTCASAGVRSSRLTWMVSGGRRSRRGRPGVCISDRVNASIGRQKWRNSSFRVAENACIAALSNQFTDAVVGADETPDR